MNSGMRIGIFGGTFDPPHLGHLILAGEALDQLELTRLLWVVTANPPHKPDRPITAVEQRVSMVNATIQNEPAFELSRVEIDRSGPHYAVDTVQILREKYPDSELYYLMGSDSMNDLPDWHRPRDFVARCDCIGVMCRPGDEINFDELEPIIPGISTKVMTFEAPLLEIASHEIRHRVKKGRQYRFFLVPAVAEIIRANNLYTA